MINVVFTGKNDNHGGTSFREKILEIMSWNIFHFERNQLDYLFWFVEWGKEPGKAWLSPELTNLFDKCKCMVIPDEIVSSAQNTPVKFQEFTAKNIAISRITKGLIIATNSDILFSNELIKYLKYLNFDSNTFYRAPRYDFLNNYNIDFYNEKFPFTNKFDMGINYCQAAGDFFAADHNVWEKLMGYCELPDYVRHLDSELVIRALSIGLKPVIVPPVYHREHPESTKFSVEWKSNWGIYDQDLANGKKIMPRNQLWGYRHYNFETIDENIFLLKKNHWEENDEVEKDKLELLQSNKLMIISKSQDLIKNNQLEEAQEILNKVLEIDANNVDALVNTSAISILGKRYSEANKILNIVLGIEPNNPAALQNLNILRILEKEAV